MISMRIALGFGCSNRILPCPHHIRLTLRALNIPIIPRLPISPTFIEQI